MSLTKVAFYFYFSKYDLIFFSAVPPTLTSSKQPYGSGDSDDGYTLIFQNLDAFQTWRTGDSDGEEERQCVEFVKVIFFFFSCFLALIFIL
jgi:hypothetical protein